MPYGHYMMALLALLMLNVNPDETYEHFYWRLVFCLIVVLALMAVKGIA